MALYGWGSPCKTSPCLKRGVMWPGPFRDIMHYTAMLGKRGFPSRSMPGSDAEERQAVNQSFANWISHLFFHTGIYEVIVPHVATTEHFTQVVLYPYSEGDVHKTEMYLPLLSLVFLMMYCRRQSKEVRIFISASRMRGQVSKRDCQSGWVATCPNSQPSYFGIRLWEHRLFEKKKWNT